MHKGSCLCGAVSFTVEGDLTHAPEACHCSQCRKQSSHFSAGRNVLKSALKIEGEDSVAWYQSSENIRRGFCSICGSNLFWAPDMDGYDYISVGMGAFDTPSNSRLAKHTFVEDKGDYYEIEDDAEQSDAY
jgi:hypothetical protein